MSKEPIIDNEEKTVWKIFISICKTINLDHNLKTTTKKNSKWNQDLNVRPETTELLEETREGKFLDIVPGNNFFLNHKSQAIKTSRVILN